MWEWVGAIALDPNPFTIMSMDFKLDKEWSHIVVRIKAMGPCLEVMKWEACLVHEQDIEGMFG